MIENATDAAQKPVYRAIREFVSPVPGMMSRHEARKLFGLSLRAWMEREHKGLITCGQLQSRVGGPPIKLYPIDALMKLREEEENRHKPNPDPSRPGCFRMRVVSRKFDVEVLFDEQDLPIIIQHSWNYCEKSDAPGKGRVVTSDDNRSRVSIGQMLMNVKGRGSPVCHVNGDPLDARRENLLVRTPTLVGLAREKPATYAGKPTTSKYKGVHYLKEDQKWNAVIGVKGKTIQLGRYRSEIDAAQAYDRAARELYGEHATINFPDPAEADRLRAENPLPPIDMTWPPPGYLDRTETCAMFDISFNALRHWEEIGRVTCGEYRKHPNEVSGRCKIYPIADLDRVKEELTKLGKPYPDPEKPGCYRVPLRGYTCYREAIIDAEDLYHVEGRNWMWSDSEGGKVLGTVILSTANNTHQPLSRMIMGATGMEQRVQYANGDPLDLRRHNLQLKSLAEQIQGNGKMKSIRGKAPTSQYKGVCFHEDRGKWCAQITKGTRHIGLGRHDNEIFAAEQYDAAARVLFGEHAYLNFPDQSSTETALRDARKVVEETLARIFKDRKRQREIERNLRRIRSQGLSKDISEIPSGTMLEVDTVRQMFDVSPTVFKRWKKLGWLPEESIIDGKSMLGLELMAEYFRQCALVVLPYPDPIRPGVYRVPISGEVGGGKEALIDADSLPLVQCRRWRFSEVDCGRGGEVTTMNPSEGIRLHQVILGIKGDAGKVGFRNDNPLDCRRENMIIRTSSEMNMNKRKQATINGKPCSSQYKGVCLESRSGRWLATIRKDGVTKRLGTFRDEIAAAQAYDEAALELFGEHARINFPKGVDAWLERQAA